MLREMPNAEFIVRLNEQDRGLVERVEKKLDALAIALGHHNIAHLDRSGQSIAAVGWDDRCEAHGLKD